MIKYSKRLIHVSYRVLPINHTNSQLQQRYSKQITVTFSTNSSHTIAYIKYFISACFQLKYEVFWSITAQMFSCDCLNGLTPKDQLIRNQNKEKHHKVSANTHLNHFTSGQNWSCLISASFYLKIQTCVLVKGISFCKGSLLVRKHEHVNTI